jgi:hypothetical protein
VPGSLGFQGSSTSGAAARTLAMVLTRIPGPGTYPLGLNINSSTGGAVTMTFGSQSWMTPLNGAAGSVTITGISESAVEGTFTFRATPMVAGAGEPVQVTQGSFRVPRSAGYTAATPDQLGSRVSATIEGAAWNAATVVATVPAAGQLGAVASNTDYSISINVGPLPGPGTGPLTLVPPVRRISVQRLPSGGFWGGSAADQGTLTITSWTANRVVGTFSGTLAPLPGTGGAPLVITGASFDLRVGGQ